MSRAQRQRTPVMRRAVALALLVAAVVASMSTASHGASGSVQVTFAVSSASFIDASGCAAGSPSTSLGTVLPGQRMVTTADCTLTFGSTNDTSQLRIGQLDARGSAMWQPSIGSLDAAFDGPANGNGIVPHPVGGVSDTGQAAATQADGKVVVVGECEDGGGVTQPCIARIDESGQLDTTFDGPSGSGDGRFLLPMGSTYSFLFDVEVQPDGRIVAVGGCTLGATEDFCLMRLMPDGSFDPSFDGPSGTGDGRFTVPVGTGGDSAYAVEVLADGRILVAGDCWGASNGDICLARFTSTGALDPSFDGPGGAGNGAFIVPIGAGLDMGFGLAVQRDGRIVVGGGCHNGANNDFCVARFDANGAWDTSFDGPSGTGDGRFMFPIGAGADRAWELTLQPEDDRIVLAGACSNGANDDFCVARLLANGGFDPAFDGPGAPGDGRFMYGVGSGADVALDVEVDERAHIVVSGRCSNGTDLDACVARLTPSGAFDVSFDGPSGSGNGSFLLETGAGSDSSYEIAARSDGRMYLAGSCGPAFCVASFSGIDDVLSYANGSADWDQGDSMFGACLRSVGGGTSAQWTATGTCDAVDGATWNPVAATTSIVARNLVSGTAGGTAHLRFGVRPASDQKPGAYVAPIVLETLAPNV